MAGSAVDPTMFGHRLRHLRRARGLTLGQLAERIGRPPSQLSLLENGKREPKLSLLQALAAALEVPVPALLELQAPNRRAELEIALERAQQDPLYAELGLPHLKPTARVPNDVLEHVVALYEELRRRAAPQTASPEEARAANAALRRTMRERENYFADVEALATQTLQAVGYRGAGALPQRVLLDIAGHFGFAVEYVQDLPRSVRSVTDLRHRRMFIPQRDALGSQDARTVVLQTLGHFALQHSDPADFADFLRQRVEANYFAGAVLVPESLARPFLEQAKSDRELSVADLEDVFAVSYEMAAHRFTNLATRHLGIPVHFVRTDESGTIFKAYENDGRLPGRRTGGHRGSAGLPALGRAAGVPLAGEVLDPLPVHRHARRFLLLRESRGSRPRPASRRHGRHAGGGRALVPGPSDRPAYDVALPGRDMLPAAAGRARGALGRLRLALGASPLACVGRDAGRHLPRRRHHRCLLFPRPPPAERGVALRQTSAARLPRRDLLPLPTVAVAVPRTFANARGA